MKGLYKIFLSFLLFFLIAIVLFVYFIFFARSDFSFSEAVECKKSGGSYSIYSGGGLPSGYMAYFCLHKYSDGGKACKSSNECEGDCMATDETKVKSIPGDVFRKEYIGGTGQCQSNNAWPGCSRGTIENPTGLGCT